MGFDRERYNERSALVLLALLGLKPNDPWTESEARSLRTVEIMGWIRDHSSGPIRLRSSVATCADTRPSGQDSKRPTGKSETS